MQTVQFAIESDSLGDILYIIIGEADRNIGLQLAVRAPGMTIAGLTWPWAIGFFVFFESFFLLQLFYGFVEDALVGFITEVGNKTGLLRAEHVSCSADIEVLHRQIESCA